MIAMKFIIGLLLIVGVPVSYCFSFKAVIPALKRAKEASAVELKAAAKRASVFWIIGTAFLVINKSAPFGLSCLCYCLFVSSSLLWYLAKKKEKSGE